MSNGIDPKKIYVIHYDCDPRFVSMNRSEAELFLKERQNGEYGTLPWKLSNLKEFGALSYREGLEDE